MGGKEVRNQLQEDSFSPEEVAGIRSAVIQKYKEVAHSADGEFKYITGKSGAMFLGYNKKMFSELSVEDMSSFCGVGNPFSVSEIERDSSVLDIGCGAGFDLMVASQLVGSKGNVCGVDLSEEMVARAQKNAAKHGLNNVEVQKVESESLPYEDDRFDVVISNGVINLSPCKPLLFREIYRVLKPGGRLQFADIILDKELPDILVGSLEAWSQ